MFGFLRVLVLFLVGMCVFSCMGDVVSGEELMDFVQDEDNGLVDARRVNGIDLKVVYRPTDLLVERELRPAKGKTVEKLRNKYGKYHYFVLSYAKGGRDVLKSGVRDQADYAYKMQEMAYNMQSHVAMVGDGKDTLQLVDYVYQNMFGASNSTELLFVFDRKEVGKYDEVTFKLGDIGFGTGLQAFRFDVGKLEDVPRIDFKR